MNIRQMRYMSALAEKGNLSDAADACFITESALTQSLSKLEHTLGTKLFNRRKNKWTPTEHGVLYLDFAGKTLELHDTFMRAIPVARREMSTIRLGMAPERGAILFPRMYARFAREFPDIQVRLFDTNYFDLQQRVLAGEIDFVMAVGPLKHQIEVKRRVDVTPFFSEELVLIVPPGHRLEHAVAATGKPLRVEQLTNEKFICHNRKKVVRHLVDATMKKHRVIPKEVFEGSSTDAAIDFVANGLGIALVPKIFTVNRQGVRVIPVRPKTFWELTIFCRKDRPLTEAERRMIDILREEHRSLCGETGS